MEYIVSFIAFFAIYFSINILIEPLRKRFNNKAKINKNTTVTKKNKKNQYNKANQTNQVENKKLTKDDVKAVFKSSLMISLIYIIAVFILKRFS